MALGRSPEMNGNGLKKRQLFTETVYKQTVNERQTDDERQTKNILITHPGTSF